MINRTHASEIVFYKPQNLIKMKAIILKTMTVLLVPFLIFQGCSKEQDISLQQQPAAGSEDASGFNGIVLDESGIPLEGASITRVNRSDGTGFKIHKEGHIPCFIRVDATSGGSLINRVTLMKPANKITFAASQPLNANFPSGIAISLPADALEEINGNIYSGTAILEVVYLGPSTPDYGSKLPGGDMMAINSQGDLRILESFGMIHAEFTTTSGDPLQIAPGFVAELEVPVDPAMKSSAPSMVPLWHFDEKDMIWKEEGTATLSGNKYVTTVSHFSWWNIDKPWIPAYIEGSVVNCSGTPVPFVQVKVNNFYNTYTDVNGKFEYAVLPGVSFPVQVNYTPVGSSTPVVSNLVTVPPLTASQIYSIPVTIVIQCENY